jgi:hypothetical protein
MRIKSFFSSFDKFCYADGTFVQVFCLKFYFFLKKRKKKKDIKRKDEKIKLKIRVALVMFLPQA